MYSHFQSEYYSKEEEPPLSMSEFLNYAPLAIINCSRQNEFLKTGTVDVRLEFESCENFPAGTTAYCLILQDRIVDYSPLSGSRSAGAVNVISTYPLKINAAAKPPL